MTDIRAKLQLTPAMLAYASDLMLQGRKQNGAVASLAGANLFGALWKEIPKDMQDRGDATEIIAFASTMTAHAMAKLICSTTSDAIDAPSLAIHESVKGGTAFAVALAIQAATDRLKAST